MSIYKYINKICIDYREEEESKKVKLQVHATNVVTEGLKLKLEKQCADLAQNPENYPTENKVALSGTSQLSKANSDPLDVIDKAKDKISQTVRSLIETIKYRFREVRTVGSTL
jgi:hypothetical protein